METREVIHHRLMSPQVLRLRMRHQLTGAERNRIKRLRTARLEARKKNPKCVAKTLKRPTNKHSPLAYQAFPLYHLRQCHPLRPCRQLKGLPNRQSPLAYQACPLSHVRQCHPLRPCRQLKGLPNRQSPLAYQACPLSHVQQCHPLQLSRLRPLLPTASLT